MARLPLAKVRGNRDDFPTIRQPENTLSPQSAWESNTIPTVCQKSSRTEKRQWQGVWLEKQMNFPTIIYKEKMIYKGGDRGKQVHSSIMLACPVDDCDYSSNKSSNLARHLRVSIYLYYWLFLLDTVVLSQFPCRLWLGVGYGSRFSIEMGDWFVWSDRCTVV